MRYLTIDQYFMTYNDDEFELFLTILFLIFESFNTKITLSPIVYKIKFKAVLYLYALYTYHIEWMVFLRA